ncbi:hypothetical protein AMECASPLE_026924 [Ameca splendens]|uniref:Uncharacterized protein n=1 Tax=Ameca splendens TaxID=208324 RepID=A0ABV0XI70_9TELE
MSLKVLCLGPSLTGMYCTIIPVLLQIHAHSRALHTSCFSLALSFYLLAYQPHHSFSVPAEAVHHVSVSINMYHSTLVCHEAWGTDPSFSWLHERAAITQQVGRVSKDGNTLFVTMTPICGHFTCMVGNKLGYSSATYTAGMSIM